MPGQPTADALYRPIADYAMIGDCHTAALVARDGAIDWFCPGRFDAPAALCRLLDARRGGTFAVAPVGATAVRRRYHGPTAVLETIFTTPSGEVRLTDFMPVRSRSSGAGKEITAAGCIMRLVEALGDAEIDLSFRPTLDFARVPTEVRPVAGVGAVARASADHLVLSCSGVALTSDGQGGLSGHFRLRAGSRVWLGLTFTRASGEVERLLAPPDGNRLLSETLRYWEEWSTRCTYAGPYAPLVQRSALTLKLLTYEPTGAIVAAPTTSLPEEIGGVRNWDYRYTWLRDSSLILYALLTIGYHDEAADFIGWVDRTAEADPAPGLQIMYTIDGGRELPEMTLPHLAGYRNSRPVRIGNAAASQLQLDIYGEVLAAAHLYFQGSGERQGRRQPIGTPAEGPSPSAWVLLRELIGQAAARWREPDQGIWEVRGGPRPFLYSRLMCWAALDRGLRLAGAYRLPAPLAAWRDTRAAIRRVIETEGFDAARGAFTQAFGSQALDASTLAIPRIGFLPATDPRVVSTVERIREDLSHHGLIYRYRTDDGLPGGEATFALCSFWLVDALALGGRLDEAHDLFERVTSYANDVGLLSEEIDATTGELLGNFPQGFSHLALIRSAVTLASERQHGPEERAETEAEREEPARRAAAAADRGRPRP